MTANVWADHSAAFADAYVREAGTVRFELVTRFLLAHMAKEQRVVDVGGGFGRQAICLARAGHSVVVLDFDPNMIAIGRKEVAVESPEVQPRVTFVLGRGEDAVNIVGSGFDLACCHSVLAYQKDPRPLLLSTVRAVRQGGLISVLCINKDAIAMRGGLQGRWKESAASLLAGREMGSQYIPTREYSRGEVSGFLEAGGARVEEWQGVGVFTDHLQERLVVQDPEEIYSLEWLAGNRDPYRQVARCFHIIARRIE